MNDEYVELEKGKTNLYKSPLTNRFIDDKVAVLHWYKKNGWDGCFVGQEAMFIALSALSFTNIVSTDDPYGRFNKYDRYDRFLSLIKHGLEYTFDSKGSVSTNSWSDILNNFNWEELERSIIDTDDNGVEHKVDCILKNSGNINAANQDPDKKSSKSLILKILKLTERYKMRDFIFFLIKNKKELQKKYGMLSCWPHLTIIKDGEIKFIEVKRSNRNTKRDNEVNEFCKDVLQLFDFKCSFCTIKKIKYKGRLIKNERLYLEHSSVDEKKWISILDGNQVTSEQAVFDFFYKKGWDGTIGEGDLIFMLLKCMSFKEMPKTAYLIDSIDAPKINGNNKCEISKNYWGLWQYNIFQPLSIDPNERPWPYNQWGTLSERMDCIRNISLKEIEENYVKLTDNAPMVRGDYGMFNPYSSFSKKMILDFSKCFDRETLVELVKLISSNLYSSEKYTFGWPDLTLYKDGQVRFIEVKAKRDRWRENQEQLYLNVLQPMRLDVRLVNLL